MTETINYRKSTNENLKNRKRPREIVVSRQERSSDDSYEITIILYRCGIKILCAERLFRDPFKAPTQARVFSV